MLPLRDHNRPGRIPLLTYTIIGINVLVYVYQATLTEEAEMGLVRDFGLKPVFVTAYLKGEKQIVYEDRDVEMDRFGRPVLVSRERVGHPDFWNAIFPFLSSMFLHGGLAHLLGNMWFLYIFSDNVEDRLGHVRYLIFYFIAGLSASLVQVLFSPNSGIPCVGASGAISGVLGAYALLFPHARVLSLVPLGFFLQIIEIPAYVFLFIWFGIQVLNGLFSDPGMGGVAWWAHIGGFVAGLGGVKILAPRAPPDRLLPPKY